MSAKGDGIPVYLKITLSSPEVLILGVKDPPGLKIDIFINREVSWLNTEDQAALDVDDVSSPVQQK